eukprot:TRINITY_DN48392_c0_g2_i1.p1 TRINITY_DN48392_c0_g2~~TRINITY_DN48392_c0_g2_i1.p1  ORF type:complete len:700 (-),score=427.22 TRINITY_DN48392_c0_g2_i1:509-2293(-)
MKLDKKHTLRVNQMSDFERLENVPEEFVPREMKSNLKPDLKNFLLDDLLRDQFVLRADKDTEIYWHDPERQSNNKGRELVYGGEAHKRRGKNWTELGVQWSPQGSYLATFHGPGLILWGGDNFEQIQRFLHQHVQRIEFSPCERYLVTSNEVNDAGQPAVIVWDVKTGAELRGFTRAEGTNWPYLKWSPTGDYVLRVGKTKKGDDAISVYVLPDMTLLDKKSIKIPNVKQARFSPRDNYISYWVPERGSVPATIGLIEIPSRKVIRERQLFGVIQTALYWHDRGEYMAVKAVRRKTKKTVTTTFEIFRVRQKDTPVDTIEFDGPVDTFVWEPKGHRFAVLEDSEANGRAKVTIYQMKKKKIIELKQLTGKTCNRLVWSPSGQHLVIAGLTPYPGALEFVDMANYNTTASVEHHQCTNLEWDTSGRYLLTSVTGPIGLETWKYAMSMGYKIWSATGVLQVDVSVERCYQIMWRPRPPSPLPADKLYEIRKNLKEKYWRQFEEEDRKLRIASLGFAERNRQMRKDEWKAYRAHRRAEYREESKERAALRDGALTDDEDLEEFEEEYEVELEFKEEVVDEPDVVDDEDDDADAKRDD